jgi:hypothetical protein
MIVGHRPPPSCSPQDKSFGTLYSNKEATITVSDLTTLPGVPDQELLVGLADLPLPVRLVPRVASLPFLHLLTPKAGPSASSSHTPDFPPRRARSSPSNPQQAQTVLGWLKAKVLQLSSRTAAPRVCADQKPPMSRELAKVTDVYAPASASPM